MNLKFLLRNSYKELKIGGTRSFFKKMSFYLKYKLFVKSFSFEEEFERWQKYETKSVLANNEKIADIKKAKIVFLVPGTHISGGVGMVFQHANRLQKRGYDVEIFSLSNINSSEWFPGQQVSIIPYKDASRRMADGSVDILIASNWSTVFTVDMSSAKKKYYYVQSDESRFFTEDKTLTEKINIGYTIPFHYFTAARWLHAWLKDKYSHDAYYVPNGLDTEMFHQVEPLQPKGKKPRILIEGSINVPFKGMDDAYNAIKDLDVEIWIVSNNGTPKPEWRYDKFFQNVPMNDMKKIYSSCDIFLKMSRIEGFFGPPMEAMACGCAVVTGKVSGYDEYIVDGENALVVEQGDINGAQKAIERLIQDKELREKLIINGYKTAKEWNWDHSIVLLEKVLVDQ